MATLAKTPNRKFYKRSDIAAVAAYLNEIPNGQQENAIQELGVLAKERYDIQHDYWLKELLKEIPDLFKGRGEGVRM